MFDFEIISHWAQVQGKDLAYADESSEITFRDFDSITRKIALLINETGIKQGDLVATILPPQLGWLCTFALHRLGVTTMSKNNLSGFNKEATPDWLISLLPHHQIPQNRTIIFDQAYFDLIKASEEMQTLPGYSSPDVIARLFSTSGTTGDVKYIDRTAGQLAEFSTLNASYDFAGTDHIMSLFPYGAGQTYRLALKCLLQGKPYFNCSFPDYRLPKVLSKYPIRTLIGSPAQIAGFLDIQKQTATSLPLIKTVIMGGSVPSKQLVDRILSQLDCRVFNAYGSSEALNIANQEITQSVEGGATLNPEVNLQIVDENDVPLAPLNVGRIRYQRPGMATSYYKNLAASAEFFKSGFFYPGDLAFIDETGKLVLDGRVNEVINLGGVKINPEAVDKIALAQLGVLDCATFASVDETGVEQLAIALVVDGDFNSELFTKAMEAKSPNKPKAYVQVTEIPRNENGKILRHKLRL